MPPTHILATVYFWIWPVSYHPYEKGKAWSIDQRDHPSSRRIVSQTPQRKKP